MAYLSQTEKHKLQIHKMKRSEKVLIYHNWKTRAYTQILKEQIYIVYGKHIVWIGL